MCTTGWHTLSQDPPALSLQPGSCWLTLPPAPLALALVPSRSCQTFPAAKLDTLESDAMTSTRAAQKRQLCFQKEESCGNVSQNWRASVKTGFQEKFTKTDLTVQDPPLWSPLQVPRNMGRPGEEKKFIQRHTVPRERLSRKPGLPACGRRLPAASHCLS